MLDFFVYARQILLVRQQMTGNRLKKNDMNSKQLSALPYVGCEFLEYDMNTVAPTFNTFTPWYNLSNISSIITLTLFNDTNTTICDR